MRQYNAIDANRQLEENTFGNMKIGSLGVILSIDTIKNTMRVRLIPKLDKNQEIIVITNNIIKDSKVGDTITMLFLDYSGSAKNSKVVSFQKTKHSYSNATAICKFIPDATGGSGGEKGDKGDKGDTGPKGDPGSSGGDSGLEIVQTFKNYTISPGNSLLAPITEPMVDQNWYTLSFTIQAFSSLSWTFMYKTGGFSHLPIINGTGLWGKDFYGYITNVPGIAINGFSDTITLNVTDLVLKRIKGW